VSIWLRTAQLAICLAAARAEAQNQESAGDLPPVGYGSLNQDQLSIRLQVSDLEVRVLPLDERLLRLVSKDGYASLHALVADRQVQIDSAARDAGLSNPGLVLVSFFGRRDDARFDPQNVNLIYRSQFYRPAAVVPITGNFSSRQLALRRQASAIYLYDVTLPIFEPFDVSYADQQSSAWTDILPVVERERGRALSRWQANRKDSTTRKP
jgi:hypothetical protein